jgi:hypothetical protein
MAMTIIEQPSTVAGKRPHQAWYSVWLSWFRQKTDVVVHQQIGVRCSTMTRLCFAYLSPMLASSSFPRRRESLLKIENSDSRLRGDDEPTENLALR